MPQPQNLQKLHHITPSGKYRNWKKHRLQSMALASAYKQLGSGYWKKSERVINCARGIEFNKPTKNQKGLTVRNRYGCKDRLCPGCQSSRSKKTFMNLMAIYEHYHFAYPNDRGAMLTLTVPNVEAHHMQAELSAILSGFRRLTRRKPFKNAVRAWFRSLEVTYNPETKQYHPHIHVMLLFRSYYFDKSQDIYLKQRQWLHLWQQSMKRTDIKILDIRVMKPDATKPSSKAMASAIAEIAKYATKPANIFIPVGRGFTVTPLIIQTLATTLKHRRLIAFSRIFRQIRREMVQSNIQQSEEDPEVYFWLNDTSEEDADYYLYERDLA